MDRALNASAPVRKPGSPNSGQFSPVQPVRAPAGARRKPVPTFLPPVGSQPFSPAARASTFHKIGLYCCCGYLFAGYANDLSIRLLGGKAYLSWLFGIGLLISFIGCGTAFRGLQSTIGKYWVGFAIGLLFSTAFSINKGASLGVVETYIPKTLLVYFFCSAFALSLRNVRTLFTANIVCTSAMLLSAVLFGGINEIEGRFCIPDSLFFGNSNDLALALVCSLGFSLYLIWRDSAFARILGAAEFLLSLYFMLKTGSRGGFLALAACLTVWLIVSNRRGRLIFLAIPALCSLPLLPSSTLSRLTEISTSGVSEQDAATGSAAQMSQYERTQLLKKSIRFAVTHPVFGTGPATFPDALYFDDVAFGTHTAALSTHNTYTQMASECGFPVFFLYLAALFGAIGTNFRIMKRTRNEPGAQGVFTMSVCLLGNLVAYAVSSGFDHVGFSWTLPLLSGLTVALYLASHGGDPRWIEAEIAAGNA
jgi:hypothetical protein